MKKGVKYYRGKFYQGGLSESKATALYAIITEYSLVNSLKHCIKDVPAHLILDIKNDGDEYEEEHGSLEGFSKHYQGIKVGSLQDFQTIGVAFMYFAESALLGDEVGLGKTVQIAGLYNVLREEAANEGREFRLCFLTEKTSIEQIRDKLIRFTGEYIGSLESGEKGVVEKYLNRNSGKRHYSIVGGHSLLASSEFLVDCARRPFDLFVIDESGILKSKSSDYNRNAQLLFKKHDRKILLNATPLETEAREFYNQLDLLDNKFLPTVTEFNKTYCKMGRGVYGYYVAGYKKNVCEFKEAVSLRYLARTRRDLGAKYEENEYKTILIQLSKEQKELMRKTTLYQMVSDYPPGVDRRVEFNLETTPKAAALLKVIESIDVKSDKALIYCRFIDCQSSIKELLESKGYRCVILNGQKTSVKARSAIVNDFNNGLYDIIITNVQRGLDLYDCGNCILYSIDPNPQKMVQVEGRMTRELNITYKSLFLLVTMGREKKFVEEVLKVRVNASSSFLNTGRSMVTEAIKNRDNIEVF